MKSLIAVFLICLLVSTSFAQDPGWPREKSNPGGTRIYYQPQLDEWKDFRRLEARMAVSIKPAGGQPTVGVIYLRAQHGRESGNSQRSNQQAGNHLDAIPVAGRRRCRFDGSAREKEGLRPVQVHLVIESHYAACD